MRVRDVCIVEMDSDDDCFWGAVERDPTVTDESTSWSARHVGLPPTVAVEIPSDADEYSIGDWVTVVIGGEAGPDVIVRPEEYVVGEIDYSHGRIALVRSYYRGITADKMVSGIERGLIEVEAEATWSGMYHGEPGDLIEVYPIPMSMARPRDEVTYFYRG